jgi:drug/metabolite transporter (DMT)-like permease
MSSARAHRFSMPRTDPMMGGRSSRPLLGIALMIASGLAFVLLDSTAKHLVRSYPVIEVVWARYFFSLVTVFTLLPRYGLVGLVGTARLDLQAGRGALILVTTLLAFVALRFLPIADTYAISFVAPLMVAAASVPLLGETIGRGQWLAILGGFLGVLLVVRPGLGAFSWAAGLPLLMAVANVAVQIMTRKMSLGERAATTMFYTSLAGSVGMSVLLPFVWAPPTVAAWCLMALMGAGGFAGQLLMFLAFRAAPASLVSPFSYTQIVWAIPIGWLAFGDLPDAATLCGGAIVVLSGLALARLGRQGRARGGMQAAAAGPDVA